MDKFTQRIKDAINTDIRTAERLKIKDPAVWGYRISKNSDKDSLSDSYVQLIYMRTGSVTRVGGVAASYPDGDYVWVGDSTRSPNSAYGVSSKINPKVGDRVKIFRPMVVYSDGQERISIEGKVASAGEEDAVYFSKGYDLFKDGNKIEAAVLASVKEEEYRKGTKKINPAGNSITSRLRRHMEPSRV